MRLLSSTVNNNTVTTQFGGYFGDTPLRIGVGAGILGDSVLVQNSTISNNSSTGGYSGDAVAVFGDRLTIMQSTITGNRSAAYFGPASVNAIGARSSLTISNSIVLNDNAEIGTGPGTVVVISCTNIIGTDPALFDAGPFPAAINADAADIFDSLDSFGRPTLADNGGAVETVALLNSASNPAIDAAAREDLPRDFADLDRDGDFSEPLSRDARDADRDVDVLGLATTVDLGAFELQSLVSEILGTAADDLLTGDGLDNRISGFFGNDTLVGRGGDDTINGNEGNDTIIGGNGNDFLFGNFDNDSISGGAGEDSVFGGFGDDTISGGSGIDFLNGDDGNDDIAGGRGDDNLFGNTGDDELNGGSGNDFIIGGDGNDTVRGGRDDDFIEGGTGDDDIRGGSGDDQINGGAGSDVLNGGRGSDSFLFEFGNPSDVDTINRFDPGQDVLIFNVDEFSFTDFNVVLGSFVQNGRDAELLLDAATNQRLVLTRTDVDDLTLSNIIFRSAGVSSLSQRSVDPGAAMSVADHFTDSTVPALFEPADFIF